MQVLSPWPIEGDESLVAHAILCGERHGIFNIEGGVTRKEELAFAYGYYLGRKQPGKAEHILNMMKEEQ